MTDEPKGVSVGYDDDGRPIILFAHTEFDLYAYEEVPLNRDTYLLDETDMGVYDGYWRRLFDTRQSEESMPWYMSAVAARHIYPESIELSLYVNYYTRFHEVLIWLPRDQFICCVGSNSWDVKPSIFVRSGWIKNAYLGGFSTFCILDVIGFKNYLRIGTITQEKLLELRYWIDRIAANYSKVAFISYGDGLLLKADWRVGTFDSDVRYSYEPEILVRLIEELRELYARVFVLPIYAVIAQGANPYQGNDLLHISKAGNHVSLNSLGIPFEQVTAIEAAAKHAIRTGEIEGAELYMDKLFFYTLSMKEQDGRQKFSSLPYRSKLLSGPGQFYFSSCRYLLDNIHWHVKPLGQE